MRTRIILAVALLGAVGCSSCHGQPAVSADTIWGEMSDSCAAPDDGGPAYVSAELESGFADPRVICLQRGGTVQGCGFVCSDDGGTE